LSSVLTWRAWHGGTCSSAARALNTNQRADVRSCVGILACHVTGRHEKKEKKLPARVLAWADSEFDFKLVRVSCRSLYMAPCLTVISRHTPAIRFIMESWLSQLVFTLFSPSPPCHSPPDPPSPLGSESRSSVPLLCSSTSLQAVPPRCSTRTVQASGPSHCWTICVYRSGGDSGASVFCY